MGRKRKTKGPKPTIPAPASPRPPLDAEKGLPPVGRGLPDEGERIVARAREKHLHKQRYRR